MMILWRAITRGACPRGLQDVHQLLTARLDQNMVARAALQVT